MALANCIRFLPSLRCGVPIALRAFHRTAVVCDASSASSASHTSGLGANASSSPPTTGPASNASTKQQDAIPAGPPKIVVLGGRGFVGSRVCQEALNTGLAVVGISPSGTPPVVKEPWASSVQWVRGNALEPNTYQSYLDGALAVISCVGAFGTREQMLKINGTANITAMETAKAAGVPKFVYVSANIPNVPGIDFVLGGYIQGKQQAEAALQRLYPNGTGVILRPGVVYGTRHLTSSFSLPLQTIFQPMEMVLEKVPNLKQLTNLPVLGAVLTPPVSVQVLAKAAVHAATDPSITNPIMDIWDIGACR